MYGIRIQLFLILNFGLGQNHTVALMYTYVNFLYQTTPGKESDKKFVRKFVNEIGV